MKHDVRSVPIDHYMKTTCPICAQKVKVIRVAVDRRRLAVGVGVPQVEISAKLHAL